jgi:TolB protein
MRSHFPRVLTLLFTASALLSAEILPPAGVSVEDANDGFILFTSDRANPDRAFQCESCEDIYVMSPDGSDVNRLTSGGGIHEGAYNSTGADWSHSKKVIAFQSNRPGGPTAQIYVMNADGTDQQPLISLPGGAAFPNFSQSGNELCFHGQATPRDIYIANVHGSGVTNLTSPLPGPRGLNGDNIRCDWSPKGNAIAFTSNRDGNQEIYSIDSDGSGLERLTTAAGSDANPTFSPKGDLIAFESNRTGRPEIWIMKSDGSDPERLTFLGDEPRPSGYSLTKPTWSPNGDRIAFHRRVIGVEGPNKLGHFEVFTINADRSGVTRITHTEDPGFSGFPTWGKWFTSPAASDKH